MASIHKIGSRWRAQVRRVGVKPITKTFATKSEATSWARKIEAEIDAGNYHAATGVTVARMIDEYRRLRADGAREVLDTSNEHYQLACLSRWLGDMLVEDLDVDDLIQFARGRKAEGAGPYTINMDVSKLGTVMRHMGPVMRVRVPDVAGQARPTLRHFGLIGGGGKRQRRPTPDELERVCDWMRRQTASRVAQRMPDVIELVSQIGLRRSEVTRIRWADLDVECRLIVVRDRKDPRQRVGNDQPVPLIGTALEIIQRQPREDERIFPLHPQTMSKLFTSACQALSIPDLHFHDLRHEAASRLDEAGWTLQEIRAVTGHRIEAHAERYINPDVAALATREIKTRR